MSQLYFGTITTAGTVIGGTIAGLFDSVVIGAGAVFTYGSSGGTATAYVQTSFDSGTTWMDVISFSFGTVTATKYAALGQPTFGTATISTTDGSLTANTIAALPVGNMVRNKLISSGNYAGTTTLGVYLVAKR